MHKSLLFIFTAITVSVALPNEVKQGADDVVAYPERNLYDEVFKRGEENDDAVAYPERKLYDEVFKREEGKDDAVAYPERKLYDEVF